MHATEYVGVTGVVRGTRETVRTVAATCLSNGGNENERTGERGIMGVDC